MKRYPRPDPVREKEGSTGPADNGGAVKGGRFEPLYQQVALWGLSLDRPFTPKEVAEAFGLPLPKALGIIHYICALGADKVSVRKTYRRGDTPMKKQVLGTLQILSVAERPVGRRYSRKRAPAAVPTTLHDLWRSVFRTAAKEDKGGKDEH